MTVKEYIIQRLDRQMLKAEEEYNSVTKCEHSFFGVGLGFQCKCCGYYTGTNTELNELIVRERYEKENKARQIKERRLKC